MKGYTEVQDVQSVSMYIRSTLPAVVAIDHTNTFHMLSKVSATSFHRAFFRIAAPSSCNIRGIIPSQTGFDRT